jgi:hypothetical protein
MKVTCYQDFDSTVFLTGFESILTEDSNVELAKRETKYPQQVNHAGCGFPLMR